MNVGLNDPSLMVVPEGRCERIDVFANAAGGVTIYQPDGLGEGPRSIALLPESVDLLIAGLLRVKAEVQG
ncbi:hypothetical protein GCM10017620_24820 [Brevundimonas intermedia]|uniref:Uncharacterized protein n=1 Tax=Brevundimonas intermedia TaxID=74315 RepID=A0ABQ5T9N1_9CAUL|nr:hypothetical protein [Brevundimonas intermedia]GLK49509.1 hypothetical protein GCM10017620_24820 [Brevundimonas intermedia]